MSEQNQQPEVAAEEQQEAVLQIQRIYVKDVSFEAPNLPHIFHQEWKPKLGFDLSTEAVQVGEDLYEVTLNINVETTMEDSGDVAFICEVKQSGVFTISGLEDVQMAHCLTSQCPNMLFPYARELISNLVNRGTFPALNLSPVNFDALFIDYMNKQQAAAEAEENQKPNINWIRAGDTVCPFILKVIEMNPSQSPITILGCGSYGTAPLSHFLAMALQPIFGGTITSTFIKCNRNVKIAVFCQILNFQKVCI